MDRTTTLISALCVCSLLTFGCNSKAGMAEDQTEALPTQPLPSRPLGQTGEWRLIFHDEFNGDILDTEKWVTCYWWNDEGCTIKTNNELQWYQPENVLVEDGKLILRAREESVTAPDGRQFNYTSGMISSGSLVYRGENPKFASTHIYVEMRARVPVGQGLWPAFWLLPTSHESLPEIDVMEILGDTPSEVHMNFHYLDKEGSYNRARNTWASPVPITDWHVFGHDWQPRGLTWYVNGVKHARFSGDEQYVPDEPMYLIANLAVGGDWPGAPNDNTVFPSDFEIDYIRVWMRE